MPQNSLYHGRFAPSPTGPLHLGSLLTAVASYLDARANRGVWRLRIDDLDTARNQNGAAAQIRKMLETAGMDWDGPVVYQSQQLEQYQAAFDRLDRRGLLYPCTCSRKELGEFTANGSDRNVYPGICRDKARSVRSHHAIRIRIDPSSIGFYDRLQGYHEQNLAAQVGDFVVRRRDRIFAYQLAVVIDDATQHITQVVRGMDLIDSTPRQIYLHSLLGLRVPGYCHVPLVLDPHGAKLSKQTGAKALHESELSQAVFKVLALLNHAPPGAMKTAPPRALLEWGIGNWNLEKLKNPKQARRL